MSNEFLSNKKVAWIAGIFGVLIIGVVIAGIMKYQGTAATSLLKQPPIIKPSGTYACTVSHVAGYPSVLENIAEFHVAITFSPPLQQLPSGSSWSYVIDYGDKTKPIMMSNITSTSSRVTHTYEVVSDFGVNVTRLQVMGMNYTPSADTCSTKLTVHFACSLGVTPSEGSAPLSTIISGQALSLQQVFDELYDPYLKIDFGDGSQGVWYLGLTNLIFPLPQTNHQYVTAGSYSTTMTLFAGAVSPHVPLARCSIPINVTM